jgi:hypothetical protein
MYRAHDDKNKILACPDCGSVDIYPVEGNTRHIPFTDDIESSLYNEEHHESSPYKQYWNVDFKDAYANRYGYNPKPRQKHFYCNACLDRFHEEERWDTTSEYPPVFPFNDLNKIDISKSKKLENVNPYDEFYAPKQ